MLELLIVTALFLAALMYVVTRRQEPNPDIAQLIGLVEDLCQRIQAPELAVVDHQLQGHVQTPPAVPTEDDDAYWESKDELANRLMLEDIRASAE